MPKVSPKFTAQFTTKLGKTPVTINISVDLAAAVAGGGSAEGLMDVLTEQASEQLHKLTDDATFKLKNAGDLKKAYKAFAKANPPAEPAAEASA
jgi:hypothetical protein